MSILNKTVNFYKLYLYMCGSSEIPILFNFWSCVAILAAAMEDRFYCEWIRGMPLKPNVYIGLIGPGSAGKGVAISQALKLLQESVDLNIYRGKTTFAHLIDKMGDNERREETTIVNNPRIFVVMDELKSNVGSSKGLIDELIALLTDLYTSSNHPIHCGTRTTGEVIINKPCISWLFASTEIWLRKVLSEDIYESGFVARTCFIQAKRDYNIKISRIKYPKDRDLVYKHLQERLWAIKNMHGEFTLSQEAELAFDNWYANRPRPEEEILESIWGREKEMVLRFAMLNSMADGGKFLINPTHIYNAINMTNQKMHYAKQLITASYENTYTKPINTLERFFNKVAFITHRDLLKKYRSKKGYTAHVLKKAVQQLVAEDKIIVKKSDRGGLIYIAKPPELIV